MSNTFFDSPSLLLTSESVTEGHPDKLCDQVSDAVLDAMLEQDPYSRVACEAAVNTGIVFVFGEASTEAWVDLQDIVRQTIREIGYDDSEVGFDWRTCGVISSLKEQAGDIARGVDAAIESRERGSEDPYDKVGAGDQGMMIGFACNETDDYLPLTISLAHRLVQRLAALRKSGVLPYLRPDGKSQVTIEYEFGRPKRLEAVVVSTQHDPDVRIEQLREDMRRLVIDYICPDDLLAGLEDSKVFVNPTGRFVSGGPASDAGLTGRKIIVDTYGGIARHGGGAFSGKDPTKVDRSASYAARHVAKNLVAGGRAAARAGGGWVALGGGPGRGRGGGGVGGGGRPEP
ncbi:MAG: methionine adenosyltransferase, partial [Chloroflexi bacterium]|nr:methionine adenosyltransferase [Chloroflexota bacterium]